MPRYYILLTEQGTHQPRAYNPHQDGASVTTYDSSEICQIECDRLNRDAEETRAESAPAA